MIIFLSSVSMIFTAARINDYKINNGIMAANIPFTELNHLRVDLYTTDSVYDITELVTEFVLYENIHWFFTYGEMTFVDNSGILDGGPMMGQEEIHIRAGMGGHERILDRRYFVPGFRDAVNTGSYSTVRLILNSREQLIDASSMFSRYMRGSNTDIIRQIYERYFPGRMISSVRGTAPLDLVIPYTGPIRAIQSLLSNTFAEDHSPLYLFDRLWQHPAASGNVYLTSYREMFADPLDADITPLVSANRDHQYGEASGHFTERSAHMTDYRINTAYNSYRLLGQGAYFHHIHHADYQTKTFRRLEYDFGAVDDMMTGDYVGDLFYSSVLGSSPVIIRRYTNSMGYAGEGRNLQNTDQIDRSRGEQIRNRSRTVDITGFGSYTPDLEIGRTVNMDFVTSIPFLDRSDPEFADLNSGEYLIAGMEHRYRLEQNAKYSVRYKLVRDGANSVR